MCLLSTAPGGHTCACPDGFDFQLAVNGRDCISMYHLCKDIEKLCTIPSSYIANTLLNQYNIKIALSSLMLYLAKRIIITVTMKICNVHRDTCTKIFDDLEEV